MSIDFILKLFLETMKNYLHLIILLFVFGFSFAQTKINQSLKKELDAIYKSDQILREYIDSGTSESRKAEILKETGFSQNDFLMNTWGIIRKQDSINLIKVEKIIAEHGYPGKKLVGEPTNEAVWYVIQHSNKIERYFPLIKEATDRKEIPFTLYAMMLDRLLTSQGKEQIYGTQGGGRMIVNKQTGKEEFFKYILPIENPNSVNERRKSAGFTTTVEENAKRMEIDYKVYTLEEIKNL